MTIFTGQTYMQQTTMMFQGIFLNTDKNQMTNFHGGLGDIIYEATKLEVNRFCLFEAECEEWYDTSLLELEEIMNEI